MDKIIIVHYIDVSKAKPHNIPELMDDIVNRFKPKDDNILAYWVPVYSETRIECINPKLITEEEYVDVKSFLDKHQEAVNEFLNKK